MLAELVVGGCSLHCNSQASFDISVFAAVAVGDVGDVDDDDDGGDGGLPSVAKRAPAHQTQTHCRWVAGWRRRALGSYSDGIDHR